MKVKFNEVKNNLVIPLLNDVGISAGELKFETTFSIQLGRGVYEVSGKETDRASGRLDILCSRDSEHLFLLELKPEREALTDADRRQGLSSGSLLATSFLQELARDFNLTFSAQNSGLAVLKKV